MAKPKLVTYAADHPNEFAEWVTKGLNPSQEEWDKRIEEEKSRSDIHKILCYEIWAIRNAQFTLIKDCQSIISQTEVAAEKLNILAATIEHMLIENKLDKI